jgi:hypothetical protein
LIHLPVALTRVRLKVRREIVRVGLLGADAEEEQVDVLRLRAIQSGCPAATPRKSH